MTLEPHCQSRVAGKKRRGQCMRAIRGCAVDVMFGKSALGPLTPSLIQPYHSHMQGHAYMS
jgi:hypothetical protein